MAIHAADQASSLNAPPPTPHVVIVGAGFGGLQAAQALTRKSVRVTVIDRRNHHLFQPLLYQIATAGLSPADIAVPIRSVLRDTPMTDVIMAEVDAIDVVARKVQLQDGDGTVPYDYLILATGATHSYFGHSEWARHAPGLKTLEDATEIRGRVLLAFEEAEKARSVEERKALLTFVIVGGGPTGIEMAGAIAELARYALARDFDHINPQLASIILVEAGPRLLAQFDPEISRKAVSPLERLGVQVLCNQRVTDITPAGVQMGDTFLPARTVIWAAGVAPSPLAKDLGVPLDRTGRVLVNQDLTIPGHPNVYVIGDLAAVAWPDHGTVPGMAPAAMQEGRHAAANILRQMDGKPPLPFQYKNKGMMATIGRASAVVDLGRTKFSGGFAWLTWLFVHIMYLIGFRNRILVLFQWAWSYLTYGRGARLIIGPTHPRTPPAAQARPAESKSNPV